MLGERRAAILSLIIEHYIKQASQSVQKLLLRFCPIQYPAPPFEMRWPIFHSLVISNSATQAAAVFLERTHTDFTLTI